MPAIRLPEPVPRRSWARRSGPWLLVFTVALALRLPFVTGLPDTPDAVRLIRAIEHFDVHEHSPHFPGYPAAVALVRMLPLAAGVAWSALAATAGALACVLLAWAMTPRVAAGGALLGGLVCAIWPFAAGESVRVATDTLVLPFIYGALGLRERRSAPLLSGLVFGFGLGMRPSAAPWVLGLLVGSRRGAVLVGLAVGIAAWLLPTLAVCGASLYWDDGCHFVAGHFTQWGGSAMSPNAHPATRVANMLEHWICTPLTIEPFGLGAGAALGAWLLVGLAARIRRPQTSKSARTRSVPSALGWGAVGYGAWIAVAQNPEHSRHVLPIVLVVIAAAASGWHLLMTCETESRRRHRRIAQTLTAAAIMALTVSTVTSGRAYSRSVPPILNALTNLAADARFDPQVDRVYAGADAAFIKWLAPDWDTRGAPSLEDARHDMRSTPLLPGRVWITGMALGDNPPPGPAAVADERRGWTSHWGDRVSIHLLLERTP
ncbi:MAG: hypothetical protein AB7O52_03370 [Planctomycetota bacterium]